MFDMVEYDEIRWKKKDRIRKRQARFFSEPNRLKLLDKFITNVTNEASYKRRQRRVGNHSVPTYFFFDDVEQRGSNSFFGVRHMKARSVAIVFNEALGIHAD